MRYRGEDFETVTTAWGLSPVLAARFFGKEERQVRRYKADDDFPEAIVMLITLMVKKGITPKTMCKFAGREIEGITSK